uniref:Matrix metallopeptidase 17b n=1 Tax=Maylandia zebra TaxID=106582 RepID=A0A3P9CMX9_9CICH
MKYGYLPPSDPSTGQLQAWTGVTSAVRAMQRFAGLKDSGVVDEETMAVMNTPRCSLPDQEESSNQEKINMRRLQSYPSSSHLSRETIRSLIFYALRVWAEPTPLEFHEVCQMPLLTRTSQSHTVDEFHSFCFQVGSPDAADLRVDFFHGYHGDDYPFDGAGGAVGHAFFPSDPARAGVVHLDAEEEWAFRHQDMLYFSEGTDLFTVLVHEFGHALGLPHSSSRHSVMRPYYLGPVGDPLHYRLGPQDLEHITQLYGESMAVLSTTVNQMKPRHSFNKYPCVLLPFSPSIDHCNTSFDAVAKIRGETFFFKGPMMWRVNGGGLVSGRGSSVRRLWRGLPPDLLHLQAVLERRSDHAIIFISGHQFWLFKDLSLQEGYPQPLSALRTGVSLDLADTDNDDDDEQAAGALERWGLVWDPEEGAVWGKIGDAKQENQGDTWTQLLKEGVNGITTDTNGSVYLFKGESYWKFMFPGSSLHDGYPRSSAADWLGCTDSSSPGMQDLSFSLSSPGGREELRESWRYRGEEEELIKRKRVRDGTKHKEVLDRGSHIWTKCTCRNGALGGRTTFLIAALLQVTWALLAV